MSDARRGGCSVPLMRIYEGRLPPLVPCGLHPNLQVQVMKKKKKRIHFFTRKRLTATPWANDT
ncbi:hypothetical protein E2C01_043437 [Portunus trituberculatus]|uniref:Uncharacterized protein n=1 Tax=Portunus trituberculatus TaxID=210409 RepID=A0A5B7FWQ7_PORTR|nr:hypothetical protein [Portunus trituberculatus]